ncbi:hypothetical protein F8154_07000 [Alkaliphilus pronyensis]|uniref:TerB family tellurite resistance protein n=1 Tax=Alkaliphilus pronyensis TaxID=1482732 RepID=A0A6I0F228_9FIRM|nr:hypothetical protein [Alkaliphilus pronyensis]KAB3535332.1 hypothetical protein F8154_07000 [Alkaliphilus pronyensis]
MYKEKVRSLDNLPSKTKLTYCKLLSLMVTTDGELNQLKVAELYRLMANIKLNSCMRERVIEYILSQEKEPLEEMCTKALADLNQQEQNILRFSLMKDLINVMKADHSENQEEKDYLSKIQSIYKITDEQLSFFTEEYQKDKAFNLNAEKDIALMIKNTTVKALAIGIPITAVYFSGCYKGLGPIGILSGLLGLSRMKPHKKKSYSTGLAISIAMGFATYYSLKWLVNLDSQNQMKLRNLLMEEMKKIHERGIAYINEDINSINARLTHDEDTNKIIMLQEVLLHLEKAKGTLENTEPHLI